MDLFKNAIWRDPLKWGRKTVESRVYFYIQVLLFTIFHGIIAYFLILKTEYSYFGGILGVLYGLSIGYLIAARILFLELKKK